MPRALRIEYPGAIYHVMNRGDRREPIFRDDVEMDCKGIAHGNVDSCGKPVEKMRRTKMPQTNNPNSDLCKYSGLTPLRQ